MASQLENPPLGMHIGMHAYTHGGTTGQNTMPLKAHSRGTKIVPLFPLYM